MCYVFAPGTNWIIIITMSNDVYPVCFFAACAANCNECTTKGSGKCDAGKCKTGYNLKTDFTACEGKLD